MAQHIEVPGLAEQAHQVPTYSMVGMGDTDLDCDTATS
jgi:hypothetical protein